uniref:Synovial sarcoma, X breakpoint 2 interacting protein b n=1 Tax=Sphaeramia orbicularis TaxID=375764 RepID=A0A673A542_9TELE
MIHFSPEVKDIHSSSVECRPSPLRQCGQSSLPLQRNSYFCTESNVQECVSSLGLSPLWTEPSRSSELNVVAVLNCMNDLIQLHHRGLRTLENMEMEQLKSSSNVDYLQLTCTRLKVQSRNTGLLERERQLHLKVKSLQNCLKNEKEENIIASRASQYNHEMKRKEREFNKLKERLNQLLVTKRKRTSIGRADGKRSLWKTEKTEAKYEKCTKTLLSDYDSRQRELLLENAELRKVLQQMKKDMVSILKEVFDSSKESIELVVIMHEKNWTNSIRLQWRRLKSHVERLDSQVAALMQFPRETHDEEMQRLKLEIHQCKDFIQTQQQLLQQQLNSPCDEETTSLLNNCYMLQEKESLRGEWKTLEEQRKIFEKERRNFTEAAIRLSHEKHLNKMCFSTVVHIVYDLGN